ncbi:hypothetical protein V8F06_013624 [Rhypophila decipiens]
MSQNRQQPFTIPRTIYRSGSRIDPQQSPRNLHPKAPANLLLQKLQLPECASGQSRLPSLPAHRGITGPLGPTTFAHGVNRSDAPTDPSQIQRNMSAEYLHLTQGVFQVLIQTAPDPLLHEPFVHRVVMSRNQAIQYLPEGPPDHEQSELGDYRRRVIRAGRTNLIKDQLVPEDQPANVILDPALEARHKLLRGDRDELVGPRSVAEGEIVISRSS